MEEYKKLRNEISKEKMEKENKVKFLSKNVGRSIRSFVESDNERAKNKAWRESLQNLSLDKSVDYRKTAIISIWDFAGQQEYYPTHQLFLSRKCIVVLVTDISKGLDEKRSTVFYERNPNSTQEHILSNVHGKSFKSSLVMMLSLSFTKIKPF